MFAALVALWPVAASSGVAALSAEPLARLPLRALGGGGLTLVDVGVGDKTLPFLLDTGGGLTIFGPDLAAPAGCTTAGRFTGFRHDGGRLDLPRCAPARLRFGGREHTLESAILDLGEFGLDEPGGLLALASFEGDAITVDLAGGELVVESEASLAERTAGMRELRVRAARQSGGASLDLFVAVSTPKGEIWLELDSGNAGPVILAPHALAQLGLELPAEATATDPAPASASVELDLVGLGPTKLEARQKDVIYDGLLNGAFFARHVVTIDLRGDRPRAWAIARASGDSKSPAS